MTRYYETNKMLGATGVLYLTWDTRNNKRYLGSCSLDTLLYACCQNRKKRGKVIDTYYGSYFQSHDKLSIAEKRKYLRLRVIKYFYGDSHIAYEHMIHRKYNTANDPRYYNRLRKKYNTGHETPYLHNTRVLINRAKEQGYTIKLIAEKSNVKESYIRYIMRTSTKQMNYGVYRKLTEFFVEAEIKI